MPQHSETEVLIAGAGPTGLTLAAQLAVRGVRCRIIDKAPARSPYSRALVVQPRTLELLAKHGLAGDLAASGLPTPRAVVYINGKVVVDLDVATLASGDTPFPFLLFVSQVETERVLEGHLHAQGVSVERPVELCSFSDDGAGVTATLRHGDGSEEAVRCRYLVGADGAHSVVRKGAGLSFSGAPYEQDFVLADVDVAWDLPHDRLVLGLTDNGPFVVFPLKGERAARIISVRSQGPDPGAGDPTLAEVQELARLRSPVPMTISNPRWLARFRLHHRGVDRYRAGRAFVAGDAAHIHSPAGGQGMNTGIQDAYNLAWKLALVLQGRAKELILDSYHEERHPVGQTLLRSTDRMFTLGATGNPLIAAARDLLLSHVAPAVLEVGRVREAAFRFIGQLSIAYGDSPIVAEELHDKGRRLRGGPGKGHRAPDGALQAADGREVSLVRDVLRGLDHHLLLFAGPGEGAADLPALRRATERLAGWPGLLHTQMVLPALPAGDTAEDIYADHGGATHARYGLTGPGHYLVRPDGYIAYRAPGLDLGGLLSYLDAIYLPAHA